MKKLDLPRIKDLYINDKKSMRKIATIFNISSTTIYLRLKNMGIKTRENGGRKYLDLNRIKELYVNQKKSIEEIARIFEVHHVSIYRRLKKMGMIRCNKRGNYKRRNYKKNKNTQFRINLNMEKIKDLYLNHKKPANKIAEMFDVSEGTIFRRLEGIGIKRRNMSEALKGYQKTDKHIKSAIEGLLKRPTSFEQKIILLCSKHRLPFVYTGDGRILIGHKNPDFIDEEDKVIIEVFLNYFKIRRYGSIENYMKVRGEHFAKYGYKTIFINEEKINPKNWEELCLNKIQEESR